MQKLALLANLSSLWQRKHQEELSKVSSESFAKQQEIRAKAEGDLKKFYEKRSANIQKGSNANREKEKAFLADRDANLDHGDSWERVAKFCDFQKQIGERDTSRMKQLLLALKH